MARVAVPIFGFFDCKVMLRIDALEIYIDGLGRGGAEQLLLDMLPIFKQNFITIRVYTLKKTPCSDEQIFLELNAQEVSPFRMLLLIFGSKSICYISLAKSQFLACVVAILKSLMNYKCKHIFCHEHTSPEYFKSSVSKLKKPIVGFYRLMLLYCLKKELVCYVVSTRARLFEVMKISKNQQSILLLPNSLPAARISSLKSCRRNFKRNSIHPHSSLKFFTFSRLHKVKQLEWAIESVMQLADKLPQYSISLSICGHGPDRERLSIKVAKETERENLKIDFPGFVESFEKIAEVSDFYLFPSRAEGFPISLTEAALTGVPIIANNCPHGPKDLSEIFSNIHLVDPPEKLRFIEEVNRVANIYLKGGGALKRPPPEWPSSEELTHRLIDFFRSGLKSVASVDPES